MTDAIERIVKESEEDFHKIEQDLKQAEKLVSRIKKDLQEGEVEIKRLVQGEDGDGAIRAGAKFDDETLRRDVNEIESDIRELHLLMSDMNEATEKFANIIGAWEKLDALKPE